MNKLAILILTIPERDKFLSRLLSILFPQIEKYKDEVSVFVLSDLVGEEKKTIGEKRNILMGMAIVNNCTHRAFIDDDDTVSDDYLDLNMPGVRGDYDCNSLVGNYYENGVFNKKFIHDIKYKEAKTNHEFFERFPNHLNVTKIALIKDYKYQHTNFGEDMEHAERVSNDGILKNQYLIEKPFYNYLFRTKKDGI